MTATKLTWDLGTAYDFFVSLEVLHYPEKYGVRGVWAAGMRSRLPNDQRDFLEQVLGTVVVGAPLAWVNKLPPPRDSATALRALKEIPPGERLIALSGCDCDDPGPWEQIMLSVIQNGEWTEEDVEELRAQAKQHKKKISKKEIGARLEWWTRAEEFGEKYLKALEAYYEVFFAEEERRIYPALQEALAHAQNLAAELSLSELMVELSQGISFDEMLEYDELTIAPSFWSSPLIYYNQLAKNHMMILFGGRPSNASLIPGEVVPDALLRALKALSDPTRLKIMHYLAVDSLTPTQLSHKLRLRAPTVVHHLQNLRVAGLVHVSIAKGKERSYALREGAVHATCQALQNFLGEELPDALDELEALGD